MKRYLLIVLFGTISWLFVCSLGMRKEVATSARGPDPAEASRHPAASTVDSAPVSIPRRLGSLEDALYEQASRSMEALDRSLQPRSRDSSRDCLLGFTPSGETIQVDFDFGFGEPMDSTFWVVIAFDETLLSRDRAAAFRKLKNLQPNARTAAMAEAVLPLLDHHDDGVRADVCHGMDGLSYERVLTALTLLLAEDLSPRVRLAAAWSVRSERNQSHVGRALMRAANFDADEDVRKCAAAALFGGR